MSTMNVSLTDELEEFVRQKTGSGEYTSSSEVVRTALRMMALEDAREQAKLEILRREIGLALDQVRAGQVVPLDVREIAAKVRKRHTSAKKK